MGKIQFPFRYITGLPPEAQRELYRNFDELATTNRSVGGCAGQESGKVQFPYRFITGLPQQAQYELWRNFEELAVTTRMAGGGGGLTGKVQFPFRFITGLPPKAQYEIYRNFDELAVAQETVGGCPPPVFGGPGDIAGLVLWLDADDAATITDAGSGAVSAWADKSGEGNDVTQSDSGRRPTTGTETINGLNVVEFVGSKLDTLVSDATAFVLNTPVTVFIVADVLTIIGGERHLMRGGSNNGVRVLKTTITDRGGLRGRSGSGDPLLAESSTQDLNEPFIIRGVFTGDANARVGVNGDTDAVGDISTLASNPAFLALGGIGSNALTGLIAEVLVYNNIGMHSGTDFDNIMGYLADKWGITLA